jgi:cysteinyl-tRNA synthetase
MQQVHEALCDSFDTAAALQSLLEVVNLTNIYAMKKQRMRVNTAVLKRVAQYVSKILKVWRCSERSLE